MKILFKVRTISVSQRKTELFLFSMFLFFLLIQFFALHPSASGAVPVRSSSVISSGLVITGESDYAPMEFLDEDGNAQGILVDIWKLWSSKTGIPVEYRCMSHKEASAKVISGEADAIAGVPGLATESSDFIFTRPYLGINTNIFIHKSVYGVNKLGDLAGFRVGFVKGDDFAAYLSEHPQPFITVMFDTYEEMTRAAASGEIRAFVCDLPVGLYFLSSSENMHSFRYVDEPVYKGSIRAAVRMDKADIAEALERGFGLVSDQEIQEIVHKWSGNDGLIINYWSYIAVSACAVLFIVLLVYIFTVRVRLSVGKAVKSLDQKNQEIYCAAKKYRETSELYRSLAENSADFIVRFDQSLKIVYANPGISILTDGQEHRLTGKTIYEAGLPSSLAVRFAGAVSSSLNTLEKQRMEFQLCSGIWVDCFFIPETDDEDESVTVLVTGRDITEIKRIEDELRQSEEKYRSLVENTPGAVYRCRKDGGKVWLIEFVSDAIEDIAGISASFFSGSEISAYRDLIHTDDQEAVSGLIHEAFVRQRHFIAEYRVRHSNGLYRWVYESGQGTVNDEGEIILIDGVVLDITEQRQAEEQMWQLRKFLKSIIDSMPSAIVGVDPAGRITQWNREAWNLTGFSGDYVTGKRFFELFPDLGLGMDNVRAAILNRTPGKYSRVPVETPRARFIADITVYPLVSNGVDGAVIRVDDVTERLKMEELMIQSEKVLSLGSLAAGMAHEINNPLAAIIQNMQVIKSRLTEKIKFNEDEAIASGLDIEKIADYARKRGIIKMIDLSLDSGYRAASIVENMLSFSRQEPPRSESVDLHEIIEKTLELAASDYDLKKLYDFKQIKIVREYFPDMPLVVCEKNKIQQVFLNILRNGAQAMFEPWWQDSTKHDPCFIIRTYIKRKMAFIEIEDNGPGMDEETRKRIFEPFFTTKAVGKGTGIGLSLAYFIVSENHGGFMEADSEKGKGCRITVMLPMSL